MRFTAAWCLDWLTQVRLQIEVPNGVDALFGVNLEVRTELQCRSLNTLQIIVANDDNYALAA
jgi:hypothetical protein